MAGYQQDEKFGFSFFNSFEESSSNVASHQVRLIHFDHFQNAKIMSDVFEAGILSGELIKVDWQNYLLAIKLSGDYYSTDKILFRSLEINTVTTIQIMLKYIRTESRDGEPFTADHFLFFRFNGIQQALKELSVGFDLFRADFNNHEERMTGIELPYIEMNL